MALFLKQNSIILLVCCSTLVAGECAVEPEVNQAPLLQQDVREISFMQWSFEIKTINSIERGRASDPAVVKSSESSSIQDGSSNEYLSLQQVAIFCVGVYGVIGILWAVHTLLNNGYSGSEQQATAVHVILLCVTWGSFSVGMNVFNKALATTLEAPSVIAAVQMVIAVVVLGAYNWRKVLEANRYEMMVWLIVPFFFASVLCSSFYTIQYISLSLLTVVRNLTPALALPLERLVMPPDKQPVVTKGKIFAILMMMLGALIYCNGLKEVSVMGLVFAAANMIMAVSDRLVQRRLLTTECKSLNSSVCAIMNNTIGLLPTMLLAVGTHEVQRATSAEKMMLWLDPRVMLLLFCSGLIGIGICYLGFECQRAISATSFIVVQNTSKIAVVVCGVVFFHDPMKSPTVVAGMALSLVGSCLYARTELTMSSDSAALTASIGKPTKMDVNKTQDVNKTHNKLPPWQLNEAGCEQDAG